MLMEEMEKTIYPPPPFYLGDMIKKVDENHDCIFSMIHKSAIVLSMTIDRFILFVVHVL